MSIVIATQLVESYLGVLKSLAVLNHLALEHRAITGNERQPSAATWRGCSFLSCVTKQESMLNGRHYHHTVSGSVCATAFCPAPAEPMFYSFERTTVLVCTTLLVRLQTSNRT